MTKKVFIRTLGCQMNVRDSEVICGLLRTMNYELATNPDNADIIIFNTCSVRQHAEDKVWSEIGRIAKRRIPGYPDIRIPGNGPVVGVVGCMAQFYKERIFERAPNVDFVVGPSDIHKIPGIINKFGVRSSEFGVDSLLERKIWETDGEVRPEDIYHTGYYEDKEHAYVVISEGCSNFCSYCVVPFVRGALRNRDYKNILKEIEAAVDKGITKITLLGQNVNAYKSQASGLRPQATSMMQPAACSLQPETVDFVKLLGMVNDIEGLKEFSFITSHPKDTTIELFEAMAGLEKLKKYLHLPVQSGSDKILKLMNRGYTNKFYLDLTENYRKIVKEGALTTDIILGFPSETKGDFQDTYDLVKGVQFNASYIFKYSTRPDTEAAKMVDDVPIKEKERRHRIILDLQKEISRKK
jgi:tRNA-2-methylthio-N6-dimethylallyladenosine synthase